MCSIAAVLGVSTSCSFSSWYFSVSLIKLLSNRIRNLLSTSSSQHVRLKSRRILASLLSEVFPHRDSDPLAVTQVDLTSILWEVGFVSVHIFSVSGLLSRYISCFIVIVSCLMFSSASSIFQLFLLCFQFPPSLWASAIMLLLSISCLLLEPAQLILTYLTLFWSETCLLSYS